jgi:hypothetical protein
MSLVCCLNATIPSASEQFEKGKWLKKQMNPPIHHSYIWIHQCASAAIFFGESLSRQPGPLANPHVALA